MINSFLEIIKSGERIETEFKLSKSSLSESIYETICAFLNRKGGYIFLGVTDDRVVEGVEESSINSQIDKLARNLNNPQFISPTVTLTPEIINVDGKKIIVIYVPESKSAHKLKGEYYDRSGSGDIRLSNQRLIANLMVRKMEDGFTENRVYPHMTMDDFEPSVFEKIRKILRNLKPAHDWLDMTNEDILISARMKIRDQETGKEGFTLAAALLFGKPNTISSVLPQYKTDALCRKHDTELYDDREDIRCNLIEAYSMLMEFVHKHLPEKPYLEGILRISLREKIFREVVANLLIHREFSSSYPATLTIFKNVVETENWNLPYQMGLITLQNLKPHPKNPVIAKVFKEIGYVEELGSGVKKMFRYCPLLVPNSFPEIEEEDVFKVRIRYEEDASTSSSAGELRNDCGTIAERLRNDYGKEISNTFEVLLKHPEFTTQQISTETGKSVRAVEGYLKKLKEAGVIVRKGPKLGGYWEIIKINN